MTVLQYLEDLASDLLIKDSESNNLERNIDALSDRLDDYFGNGIIEKFVFGSYKRDTSLSTKYNKNSDIDYMVCFNDQWINRKLPQTYRDRLKRFTDHYYGVRYCIPIKQSSPTIQVKLSSRMIELAPVLKYYNCYYIAIGDQWQKTNPTSYDNLLVRKNVKHRSNIKPLIRIIKLWNNNNYNSYYSSSELEEMIVEHIFSVQCINLKDYFYDFMDYICKYNSSRTKQIIENVKSHESLNNQYLAKEELKKLFKIN